MSAVITVLRRHGVQAKPHIYKAFSSWVCAGSMLVATGRTAGEAFKTYQTRKAERDKAFDPRRRYSDHTVNVQRPWRAG